MSAIREFVTGIFRAIHPTLQGVSWMYFPGREEKPDDLFKEAKLEDQNDVSVKTGDGYVIYRRADVAAIADNDTTVLELLRRLIENDQKLIGAHVSVEIPSQVVTTSVRCGVVIEVHGPPWVDVYLRYKPDEGPPDTEYRLGPRELLARGAKVEIVENSLTRAQSQHDTTAEGIRTE